jgi:hypothetical protein
LRYATPSILHLQARHPHAPSVGQATISLHFLVA